MTVQNNKIGASADDAHRDVQGFSSEGASMLSELWAALGQPAELLRHASVVGEGELPSVCAVTDIALASIGAATLSMAHLLSHREKQMPSVQLDRVLASRWFACSIRPIGWRLAPTWDAIAGDYETSSGWIKLHTNAPLHRAAVLRALGLDRTDSSVSRAKVAAAVRTMQARDLESEVIRQGGCAAQMRSAQAWSEHPQGQAVRAEPLLAINDLDAGSPRATWSLNPVRPLQGIRVLDLTRILAGPVATRYLAGYGAEILRIDPPDWDEPVIAPEVTLGKRRARLNLRSQQDRNVFERLLVQADVLVHGYRSDALERLGFGLARRRELNPELVDVSLNAYGWTGDWRTRRGFDSLVQMSAGIAEAGMTIQGRSVPMPLPVQALDHATGYMLAASVLRGLLRRVTHGGGSSVRASLARTATMLMQSGQPRQRATIALRDEQQSDWAAELEHTSWGPARRLLPSYAIEHSPAFWKIPAGNLGDGSASWQ